MKRKIRSLVLKTCKIGRNRLGSICGTIDPLIWYTCFSDLMVLFASRKFMWKSCFGVKSKWSFLMSLFTLFSNREYLPRLHNEIYIKFSTDKYTTYYHLWFDLHNKLHCTKCNLFDFLTNDSD